MSEQTDEQQQQQSLATEGKKKPISILEHIPQAAKAVLTKSDIGRMIDLGLGRGVDATNPTPWLNKTAFQVRNVAIESVIGTEEGGALQSYERETTSVYVQQSELKASVAIPQAPISIGVEAEHSRSYNTTRRAVGKKVVNRTISFRAVFDDVPLSRALDPEKMQKVVGKRASLTRAAVHVPATTTPSAAPTTATVPAPTTTATVPAPTTATVPAPTTAAVPAPTTAAVPAPTIAAVPAPTTAAVQSELTFEEQLAQWILQERMLIQQEISPITKLGELIHRANGEELKELGRACHDFVNHFHITHYVSAIELGASEYRVMSQSEYYSRIGGGGTFGLETLANSAVSTKNTSTWKKTKRASELKRVGMIYKDAVERGSYDEAVVGVDIQPITNLVKLPRLRMALQRAILDYMDEQGQTTVGPFLISCDNDRIFWSVTRNNAIKATTDKSDAAAFHIIRNDEGEHPYEFIIGYYGEGRRAVSRSRSAYTLSEVSQAGEEMDHIPRYVSANVNQFGTKSGPLHLKFAVGTYESRMTIHSRLGKGNKPVDTNTWIGGREAFYIKCVQQKLKKDGYICVKSRISHNGDLEYATACAATKRSHNEHNLWMLFRLQPASSHETPISAVEGLQVLPQANAPNTESS